MAEKGEKPEPRGRREALYGKKEAPAERQPEKDTEGKDDFHSADGAEAQKPDIEAHGGGPGAMFERHAAERADMHGRHERERMALHGAHRDEHRAMEKAHEAEHSGMYANA